MWSAHDRRRINRLPEPMPWRVAGFCIGFASASLLIYAGSAVLAYAAKAYWSTP